MGVALLVLGQTVGASSPAPAPKEAKPEKSSSSPAPEKSVASPKNFTMTAAAAPDMSKAGGERPAWAATPIMSETEVEKLSDRQLEALFKNGTADVPGYKEKNVYQFCKGHTIINAWTQPVGGDISKFPILITHPQLYSTKQNHLVVTTK